MVRVSSIFHSTSLLSLFSLVYEQQQIKTFITADQITESPLFSMVKKRWRLWYVIKTWQQTSEFRAAGPFSHVSWKREQPMNQNLTEQKSLTCYPVAKRVLLSSKFKLLITVITPQTEAARKLHPVMIRMIITAWQGADHWYCGAAPLHRSPLQQYSLQFQNHI